jgi:signal peptidase I
MAGDMKPNTDPKREQGHKTAKAIAFIWRWIAALVLLAVLLINLFTHIFQVVNYNGTGMEPNLRGGQTLVILKTDEVREGDIIAFYYNNQVLVRRVICEGGKQLEIGQDGVVHINGSALDEPYLKEASIGQCNLTFPYHVRTGTVFVMGDNRTASMDSRLEEIGTIPTDRIIGKVIIAV